MNGTWTRAWVGPALVVGLWTLSGCDDGGADTDTDGPVDSGAAGAGGAATGGTGGAATGGTGGTGGAATGGTGGSAGSGAGGSGAGGSGGAGGRLACPHTPAPRGDRLLGIDLLNVNESADFDANLRHAATLRVQFLALHLLWTQLEPAPGTFEDPGGALGAFAGVVEQEDLRFSLTIRPIDLTGKTVPEDLEDVRFNDGEMLARFLAALDFALGIFPADRLTSIQIGNEIDGFDASGEHPDFWSDYGAFLAGVVAHVRTTYPGLRVGFTGTLHGLTEGPLRDVGVWTAYAGVVDVVGVTHYPLDGAFQVRAPTDVFDDLDRIATEFPDTPLLFQEVGYQSAAASGSSEAKQAAFFCDFFAAWDQHADHIEAANIVRLNDVSEDAAAELAGPYGLDQPAFLEYLRTLGLRTWSGEGRDKAAFEMVRDQAAARGW